MEEKEGEQVNPWNILQGRDLGISLDVSLSVILMSIQSPSSTIFTSKYLCHLLRNLHW